MGPRLRGDDGFRVVNPSATQTSDQAFRGVASKGDSVRGASFEARTVPSHLRMTAAFASLLPLEHALREIVSEEFDL